MDTEEFDVETGTTLLTDLTRLVTSYCSGRSDGLLHVFVPHATAGLALFELHAGSDYDLVELVERLLPRDQRYRHRHGSPGHGADHLLPVLISPSVTLPVLGGIPALGTWQSLVLVDSNTDNLLRRVRLSFLPG